MRLDDLLRVMREEFAQAADDIDGHVMAWCSDAASAGSDSDSDSDSDADTDATADADVACAKPGAQAAQAILLELSRVAQTARVIALEGMGVALDQLAQQVQRLAHCDDTALGEGLTWMFGWRAPFEACFAHPGNTAAADQVLALLALGPQPPDTAEAAALRELLVCPAVMPASALEDRLMLPPASAEDVSLQVPTDVDADLYETFLADAPGQLARLADAMALLVRGELPPARVQEAQRVAHTFKGSGNIVGIRGVGRLAHRIEDLIEFAAELGSPLPAPMAHDLEQATATLDQMLYALRGEEEPPTDAQAKLQALLDWVNAIRADNWPALVAQRSASPPVIAAKLPVAPGAEVAVVDVLAALQTEVRTAAAAVAASTTEAPVEAPAQMRVDVAQLDRLVRRAGQDLVRSGRITEHLRSIDERLRLMEQTQRTLQQRLAELQLAVDRQGVSLNQKAEAAEAAGNPSPDGTGFDPLEMDRYNQLHTLSRFVVELVADGEELRQAARAESLLAASALRDHGQSLKDQHRELIHTRMVPFQRAVARLRRTVKQTAGLLGKSVRLEVQGEAVQLDSDVLERLTEPLLHLLRNAVDHGIETAEDRALLGKPAEGVVSLQITREGHRVVVVCRDDGRGIDLQAVQRKAEELGLLAADSGTGSGADGAALGAPALDAAMVARLILLPGFSTCQQVTEVSGRGVGMDVVADRVRAMKGQVDIQTLPLQGTTITLRVPATTGSLHALVVQAGGALFALATDTVVAAVAPGVGSYETRDAPEPVFVHGGQRYPTARLADWLGLEETSTASDSSHPLDDGLDAEDSLCPVVLVRGAGRTVALRVQRVVDTRELVLQDTGVLLRQARGVAGGALRSTGEVLFVLDPAALDDAAHRPFTADAAAAAQALKQLRQRAKQRRQHVLVVDDAISVRKALVQLLQDAGYDVSGARDGFDALHQLKQKPADMVLTDLEMPNLNGLDFTRLLREQNAAVPVVMITSRSTQKHRDAAQEAGVNLYLTKPYTDVDLLAHVRRLCLAPQ